MTLSRPDLSTSPKDDLPSRRHPVKDGNETPRQRDIAPGGLSVGQAREYSFGLGLALGLGSRFVVVAEGICQWRPPSQRCPRWPAVCLVGAIQSTKGRHHAH